MLPANKSGNISTNHTNNTNRCLIKSAIERTVVRLKETSTATTTTTVAAATTKPAAAEEEDVTQVEYDIINYYADTPMPRQMVPRISANPCQMSSASAARHGNSSNNSSLSSSALESGSNVVVVAPARRAAAAISPGRNREIVVEEMDVELELEEELEVEVADLKQQAALRSRVGGGGGASSRLRRTAAIVPARSRLPESCNGGSTCSSSSSSSSSTSSTTSSCNSSPTPTSPCSTLGVNMRVTGQCSQGGRKYMEDQFSVAYQESPLTHELEYAFFGIYDGHGGPEAALFAKEHLMLEIVKQKLFWSDQDEDVLRAIREGYIATHFAMWREQEKWPRTANGHLSTAGTTATVAFMRREKIYIGHVGDSGIVLGYQNKGERTWRSRQLTTDHKPESLAEKTRIQRAGGNVAIKSGVPRVVWNRPRDPLHRGPIRRRTVVDDIPFLAVARSLGDLWSYNSRFKEFVVSPDPDVKVVKIDPSTFRCLIFGTDGLWNVVSAQEAVDSVRKEHMIGEILNEQDVMNPSKALVDQALKTWASKKMRADNTSVVTVILTPAASHNSTSNPNIRQDSRQGQTVVDPEVDVELLLEAEEEEDDEEDNLPVDIENSCPAEFLIEEEEYHLDTPYSALAKRHLPPEPYRDFDYYALDEDETEEEDPEPDHDHEQEIGVELPLQQNWFRPRKTWRKSTINNSWTGETETDPERVPHPHPQADARTSSSSMGLYSHAGIDKCAIYGNSIAPPLEQPLESSYSFAESYNSLLNEQEELEQARSRSVAAAAAAAAAASSSTAATCSVQEMIQEQQHYQQQEGYSLTQLETRRERERVSQESWQEQEPEPTEQPAEPQQPQIQPVELLELDALLQQERAEEEQVALEQLQQREQQMEVASSSSSSSGGQQEFSDFSSDPPSWLPEEKETAMELEMELEQDLQDNEVSSTLPATPTQQMEVPKEEQERERAEAKLEKPALVSVLETVTETRKEDTHAVHYIFEKIQKHQETEISPVAVVNPVAAANSASTSSSSSTSTSLALGATASNPRIRQMRRYRNVPNENHQHMQTRRRQVFKHAKPKSFIGGSAAAIVAYGDGGSGASGGNGSGASAATNPSEAGAGAGIVGEGNSSSASRRRSVNVNAVASSSGSNGPGPASSSSSSSSSSMTRRSHSLTQGGGGVSKRQLRSSLCSLGLGLDMTKRTLRTRNVPIATGGGAVAGGSGAVSGATPANPNSSSTPRPVSGSVRRLKRSHEDREQRRSLRSSAGGGGGGGVGGGGGGGGGVGSPANAKPNRLQACNGAISARPPPSPKKLNAAVPTLAIGTRAYTAALAAAADHLNKRWSLRSSSGGGGGGGGGSNNSLITAISCYSARSRAAAAAAAAAGGVGGGGGAAGATAAGAGGAGATVTGGATAMSQASRRR
ncbi:hypothetical protein KR009_003804 [Drosophila setifemur]|nr:hypothetical protein KR009_003804 [Drosophila setifemur]